MNDFEKITDAELLQVIRMAENSVTPGSRYQRAVGEWNIRQQDKILNLAKLNKGGIFFEVGGDMVNHGVMQTGEGAVVSVAVAGKYSSNENTKIIQGGLPSKPKPSWYEKPLGVLILTVVGGILVSAVAFSFGWN